MGAAALLVAGFGLYAAADHAEKGTAGEVRQVQSGRKQEEISDGDRPGKSAGEQEGETSPYDMQVSDTQAEECAEEAGSILESFLLVNTEEGNQAALLFGRELELKILRCLAAVYEREEMTEEAVHACARLIEIEDRKEMIETAGLKKMQLEAAEGQYGKAVLTGEEVLRRLGESEQVAQLTEEYRQRKEEDAYGEE